MGTPPYSKLFDLLAGVIFIVGVILSIVFSIFQTKKSTEKYPYKKACLFRIESAKDWCILTFPFQ